MILVWFNPNNETIYHRYIKSHKSLYYVGYENCYGHIVLQILYPLDDKLVSIYSFDEYLKNLLNYRKNKKNKLISFVRKLLK